MDDSACHESALLVSEDRSFRVEPGALAEATGWELKPEGLCRGDVCVPVRDRDALVIDGRVDVRNLAELLRRPLALDEEAGVAVMGAAVTDRAAERDAMQCGDFTLNDWQGNPFRWSSLGRKKKLLFAWASW